MTYQEVMDRLSKGVTAPCYLICGNEPLLTQRLLKQLKSVILEAGTAEWNEEHFYGENARPQDIVVSARTLPMMARRRLVIVYNADLIEDPDDEMVEYVGRPVETTVMVLTAEKADMRKRFFIAMKDVTLTCLPLRSYEVIAWIAQEGRGCGMDLPKEVLQFLAEYLGNDRLLIHQELDKLALRFSQAHPIPSDITLASVKQMVGQGRHHTVFELIRCLGEKDIQGAMRLLVKLYAEGEPPLKTLFMLTKEWRMMAMAKEAIRAGLSPSDVAQKIGLKPFLLKPFFEQLKKWRAEEIRRAFDLSLSADAQLKGGCQAEAFVLEMLVLDLCGRVGDMPYTASVH